MLLQTVEQIMPLLQLLPQPAFCICEDHILTNRPACLLAPASAGALPEWLGKAAAFYADWDRQSGLELPMSLAGQEYSLSILPLVDGTLFLLTSCSSGQTSGSALAVASQVLRQPLNELYILSHRLFGKLECHMDSSMHQQAAALNRQLYRMLRLSSNLADLELLRSGHHHLRQHFLDLVTFLDSFVTEAQSLCREAGRVLTYLPPKQSIRLFCDQDLVERALWNLLSNAIKYGDDEEPICLRVEICPQTVVFSVRNHCCTADSDLLSAAFTRMEQRGVLPDPGWGVGLGLPLVRHIAQLHGGAVALEARDNGSVTITMSINRKTRSGDVLLESPPPMDYSGGMRRSLVELSDVLPASCFHLKGL